MVVAKLNTALQNGEKVDKNLFQKGSEFYLLADGVNRASEVIRLDWKNKRVVLSDSEYNGLSVGVDFFKSLSESEQVDLFNRADLSYLLECQIDWDCYNLGDGFVDNILRLAVIRLIKEAEEKQASIPYQTFLGVPIADLEGNNLKLYQEAITNDPSKPSTRLEDIGDMTLYDYYKKRSKELANK